MATGELSDADVFGQVGVPVQRQTFPAPGAPGQLAPAPPIAPVQVRDLPAPQGANDYGQPFAPTGLSDADVGINAATSATPGKVSEVMGLEKGLAEPFARFWDRVSAVPTLAKVSDSAAQIFPAYDAARQLSPALAKLGMNDVAARGAAGQTPGKLGEFAGNALDTLAIPGGPLLNGGLSGALLSKSDNIGGVLKDAAIGAVGGKLAHGILGGLSSMITPTIAPAAKTLLDEGVPLTMGQIRGGALHRVEDAASSFPIVGDVIKGAQHRSLEGLNLAVANRALRPIGEAVPADIAPGRDAIAYAGDKLSQRYDNLIPSLTMQADSQLGSDLHALGVAARDLPKEHADTLGRILSRNIVEKIDPATGTMPGEALKDAESTLALHIGRYGKSPMPADQNLADGLSLARSMLRDWVARSNPHAADELSRLNTGWANLAIGEKAAGRLGATDGIFTPSQLAGAVRDSSDTVRKRGYARGTALMQDLSDAALERLPQTVPDSGSPYRHALEAAVAGMVGKEAGMAPFLGKATIAGGIMSAPYTKAGQKIAQDIMAGPRPAYAPQISAILQRLQRPAAAMSISGLSRLGADQP